jgi:hypothetical protein
VTSSSTMQRPAPGSARGPGGSTPERPGGPVRAVQRRRLPALIAVGMFLVLGCAAIGAALFLRVGQSTTVLALKAPVAQGAEIQLEHLRSVSVRLDGSVKAIRAADYQQVVGTRAKVALQQGNLLFAGQFERAGGLQDGQSVVALALKPGQSPGAGLSAGDVVAVVHTPSKTGEGSGGSAGQARTVSDSARVRHVSTPENGDTIVVDLIVTFREAEDIAAIQALGEASLILLPASS